MQINDSTRRIVADRLLHSSRKYAVISLFNAIDDVEPMWRPLEVYAALIYRPECVIETGGICSVCGRDGLESSDCYCRNCGAEVIEDDDRS